MLAFIIDLIGAYIIANRINKTWLLILVAVLVGIFSAIIGSAAIFYFTDSDMTEAVRRIIAGLWMHPVLTVGVALITRRMKRIDREFITAEQYAIESGKYLDEVIEDIKNHRIEGKEKTGEWFVKIT